MMAISDEEMRESLAKARSYSMVILRKGPRYEDPGARPIIVEHGRRNMALRKEGILPIVCPTTDQDEVRGIGIFAVSLEECRSLMESDPGVVAGIFSYELHPARGFPGSSLPDRDS